MRQESILKMLDLQQVRVRSDDFDLIGKLHYYPATLRCILTCNFCELVLYIDDIDLAFLFYDNCVEIMVQPK